MGKNTDIQWADSTVNPVAGCTGCELWSADVHKCYAGLMTRRFAGKNAGWPKDFGRPEMFPGRMEAAAKWGPMGQHGGGKPWLEGQPRLIFVGDMGETFSANVPLLWLFDNVIVPASSEAGRRHMWLLLTKQPVRMLQLSKWLEASGHAWPDNVVAGVTVTSNKTLGRLEVLDDVHAAFKLVSIEPMLDDVHLDAWLHRLDWVIIGGESGADARPFNVDYARELIERCSAKRVPVFLKQLGGNPVSEGADLKLPGNHGGDWLEWPEHLRVREVPNFGAILRQQRPPS